MSNKMIPPLTFFYFIEVAIYFMKGMNSWLYRFTMKSSSGNFLSFQFKENEKD